MPQRETVPIEDAYAAARAEIAYLTERLVMANAKNRKLTREVSDGQKNAGDTGDGRGDDPAADVH